MDRNDRFPMASREPNPLRPYYIPPSIGLPPSDATPPSNRSSFPAAARELFSDIDYESYIPDHAGSSGGGGGIADMTKRIVDQAIWNYTSVLLAQPFEVAKIVLQCYQADSAVPVVGGAQRVQTPVRTGFAGEPGVCLVVTW